MDLVIRPVATEEEFDEFRRCDGAAFAFAPEPERREQVRAFIELDRTVAAFESGRIVGASANVTLELTVPGPYPIPTAGVTWVGVLPTHRRRGVLTAMMAGLLADARARNEPLVALGASESIIYGRFGLGAATFTASYEIERAYTAFARPVDDSGRFTLLEREEAEPRIKAVYDRARRAELGEVSRGDAWWADYFADWPSDREGAERQFHVVHERAPGDDDGYVTYRYHHRWNGVPDGTVEIKELVATEPETRLALLRFCFDLDLATKTRLPHFPVDEPARWALADPRRLRMTANDDWTWIRLVDVAAALAARAYRVDARLVIDVEDRFLPDQAGRYELVTGADGAHCRRTDAEPDLAVGVGDLAAVYLGGVRPTTLAAAGRVRELTPGSTALADLVFATDRTPFSLTEF